MKDTARNLQSDTATARPRSMPVWAAADFDDARRYAYTEGWDDEDAELGWVDAEVVSRPRRLH